MTKPTLRAELLALLEGDEDLLEAMCEAELVPRDEHHFTSEHAETARVVHTLVRELDVNWAGVEVIVRMRTQLIATRKQLADLVELVRSRGASGDRGAGR